MSLEQKREDEDTKKTDRKWYSSDSRGFSPVEKIDNRQITSRMSELDYYERMGFPVPPYLQVYDDNREFFNRLLRRKK